MRRKEKQSTQWNKFAYTTFGSFRIVSKKQKILHSIAVASILFTVTSGVFANPSGGKITTGSGSIEQTGSVMTVTQNTDRMGIDWQSFSIGANETVNFLQPNAGSVALNRVIGNQGSIIYGRLNANGKVFLVNSAGILFAPGSQVNVGSLVASGLNITDGDFQKGSYTFSGGQGVVGNQGTIQTAAGGYIVLLGSEVKNEGFIIARQGTIALGAGNAVTLDMHGDDLVRLAVDSPTAQALVENKNLIQANGGNVIMTARAANTLARTVVNNSGIIEAKSIGNVNGSIVLDGGANGIVSNSGTLDASGRNTGQVGGTVKVLGEQVALLENTRIDASGDLSGGTVLIGGNRQGKGSEQNARQTSVAKNTLITADALTSGSGGNVVVWADGTTNFNGIISAQGGKGSGDGGQAEVSGKQELVYQGFADLRATNGKTGTLLLDPSDFIINSSNVGTIQAQLSGSNLIILSSQGMSGTAGDILVNSGLNWSGSHSLTLSAYHNISVNAPITAGSGANVTLRADNTGNGSGTVSFSGSGHVNLSGGTLSIYYNPANYAAPVDYSANVSGGGLTAYMLVNTFSDLDGLSRNSLLWNKNYALGCDIDASGTSAAAYNGGAGFIPIGNSTTPFTGNFDGDSHTISNLYINRPSSDYVGLFGYSGGSIRNVNLSSVNITGQTDVGGLAGYNTGSVRNSSSTGIVEGVNFNVGGLVGDNHGGSIGNSDSMATVHGYAGIGGLVGTNSDSSAAIDGSTSGGTVSGDHNIGGLVGLNFGSVNSSSHTSGNVTGYYNIGGLAGANEGSIVASFNTGNVNGNEAVGGLTGYGISDTIADSYNKGTVTGAGNYVGGLVGVSNDVYNPSTLSSISNSYNSGTVQGKTYVGGLVGNMVNTVISNSYNTGAVTGLENYTGGIAGQNWKGSIIKESYNTGLVNGGGNYVGGIAGNNNESSKISNSYNSGMITGGTYVGGIAGVNNNLSTISNSYSKGIIVSGSFAGGLVGALWGGSVASSYWDTETSGLNYSEGGTGKTTNEMKQSNTFIGWDWSIWGIVEGASYPYLYWQFSAPTPPIPPIPPTPPVSGPVIRPGDAAGIWDSTKDLEKERKIPSGSSNQLIIQIENQGVNMPPIPRQGLFTVFTDKGEARTIINIVMNGTNEVPAEQNKIYKIKASQGQLTLNPDMAGALSAVFLRGMPQPSGMASVAFDGKQFIISDAGKVLKRSEEKPISKDSFLQSSFAFLFADGQTSTYRVICNGSHITVLPSGGMQLSSGQLTGNFGSVLVPVALKVVRDVMQVPPESIVQIAWKS